MYRHDTGMLWSCWLTDRGILVPFGDSQAIGREVAALLTDDRRRLALRKCAYAVSRSMTWSQTARRHLSTFEKAREFSPARGVAVVGRQEGSRPPLQSSVRPFDIRQKVSISHLDNSGAASNPDAQFTAQ